MTSWHKDYFQTHDALKKLIAWGKKNLKPSSTAAIVLRSPTPDGGYSVRTMIFTSKAMTVSERIDLLLEGVKANEQGEQSDMEIAEKVVKE